jgi:phosphate butyryltransferase
MVDMSADAPDGNTGFSFQFLDQPFSAPVHMAVAAAEEEDVLQAVMECVHRGIVFPYLIGSEDGIRGVAERCGLDLGGTEIIDVKDPEEATSRAVAMVADGDAAMLMKGLVDTSTLLKAVLRKDHGLRGTGVLSHLALFEIDGYPRPLAVTDAAMNIAPDLDTKREILRNAVSFLHRLGYREPKVAVLAAKEKVNEKMPATIDAAALRDEARRGDITGCLVDGPFALDNAVSVAAAATKGIDSPVAGRADILLVPRIESGNILYKALAFLAPSRNAGVILGARAPIVLTSRADSRTAKALSIALAAYAASETGRPT